MRKKHYIKLSSKDEQLDVQEREAWLLKETTLTEDEHALHLAADASAAASADVSEDMASHIDDALVLKLEQINLDVDMVIF